MNGKRYTDWSDRTLLILRGSETVDFLQRLTTNDVSGVTRGPVRTVLTNEKGRIVDLLSLLPLADDGVLAAGLSKDPGQTASWLERFIIIDDVSVHRASEEFRHLVLLGTDENPVPDAAALRDEWGTHLFVRSNDLTRAVSLLKDRSYTLIGPEELESTRIVNGIPDWPAELAEPYNPLEARLDGLISWTKGCYVGQEVIARLDSYKKLQRVLVSLVLEGSTKTPADIRAGATVVGTLTSIASHGVSIYGLGYVKPIVAEERPRLEVGQAGEAVPARIV